MENNSLKYFLAKILRCAAGGTLSQHSGSAVVLFQQLRHIFKVRDTPGTHFDRLNTTFIRIENFNQQLVASKVSRTLNSFKCVHLPWNAVTTFHGTRAHSTRIGHDVKCENSNSFQCPILCVKLKLFLQWI